MSLITTEVKIFSWNVNGLRSVERKKALKWVDEYEPNILCLQETKLSSVEYQNKLFTKEYSLVSINNSEKKGSSGTLTYSDVKIDEESICTKIDSKNEGRIIEYYHNDVVIFNVYFPNGKVNKTRLAVKIKFYEDLLQYCQKLREEGKSIIICGDFNTAHQDIDLKKTKITNKSGFSDIERACLDKFMQNGYIDTYRHIHGNNKEAYTWWSYRSSGRLKNEGWRIDYILISEDLIDHLQEAYILDHIYGSDHCPIGIRINFTNFETI